MSPQVNLPKSHTEQDRAINATLNSDMAVNSTSSHTVTHPVTPT